MTEFLLTNETTIRLVSFIGAFILFGLLEVLFPKRQQSPQRKLCWTSNLSIIVLNSVLVKTIVLWIGVNAAIYAQQNHIGLFNILEVSDTVGIILSLIILDCAIYWQHRLAHVIPVLWKLHRLHHSDIEYDMTTALRFHPLEIIFSYAFKFALVLIFGVPLIALVIFEVVLNAAAIFNHSNLNIPVSVDKIIRLFVVTPDMHRIHHSVHTNETNSNYGFNISLWDRVFGSYIDQPKDPHKQMEIGLKEFRPKEQQTLWALLKQPFK